VLKNVGTKARLLTKSPARRPGGSQVFLKVS
jgi:hypothetical protein